MASGSERGLVMVTGATGHIGREVCRLLKATGNDCLGVDVDSGGSDDVVQCDLRLKSEVASLFRSPVRAVIHLAGILPSAFHSDPLAGVDVNLGGSFELMREAVKARVRRFVFASSMSVYGAAGPQHPLTEDDPAIPDEPYGASKRVVELVGETLAKGRAMEFVSLRIARVVGPGIKKTSSPWRSQLFERTSRPNSIEIPYASGAKLSLVHAEDVGRMLVTLAEKPEVRYAIYNTPVETWEARHLKKMIEEVRGIRVELGRDGVNGGPLCDGRRFAEEFGFQARGLRERLASLARI
jgi:nucleoside-diphosphate-sugar epimerase